ncbi:glycosyltransferase [Levilactobacillus koreensis JCM 16448]|uniref:Glycosyltransferase n=1 Tax=Levilactobacillus koreensis TaxID=637971 RepID=A0AAC8UVB9_9LACO|nr:YfhO family protein [Levilactobacillus koreensis]AKP64562.1 glycosyltransferase [Levilactobacillus koreensis]KRK91781.1 glycosyltransferase [Levilactobacillus koreensis JCM 16448]
MEIAHRRWPLWMLYTLAFAVIAALSFGVFGLANRTLIWNMDGVTQHYPVMLELHRLLAKSGLAGVTGWSWTFGLGADKLTTLAYYVLGDPFAYVLALFPIRMMETGYGVFIVLRLYATGLAFLALAHRYTFRLGSQLLGAVTYAFTGYSLMIGVHHPFFLLPMIWFPLLLVGIDRILRGHGWQLLGWVTGLAILSNFYFAYILGLGSLIYAVIRFWSLQQQGLLAVKWPVALRRFLLAAVSGILLAGILLIPSLLMMLKSTRVGTIFANGLWLYPGSYYLKLANAVLTTGSEPTYWAVFGMSGVTFFGCVYVLRHWRENRPLALTLVLMAVGLLFPAVAAFFNVLSTPSNRWLLLAAVPFGLATMVLSDHLNGLTKRDRYWLAGSAIGLLLVVYAANGFIFSNPERDLVTYGVFLATTVVVLGSAQWTVRTTIMLLSVVVGANLVNNAWGYYDPNMGSQATDQLRQGDATRYIQDYFDGAQTAVQHQSTFSRVNTAYNFNLLRTVGNNMTMSHGLNGIMSYFSVQNGYVGQFSRDLQNAQVAMNAPLGQADNRTAMDNLLGVKTIFAREDQVANRAALPYGYHAEKQVYPEKPVYGLSNGTGTQLLTTTLNFPLVYTQPTAMTRSAWQQLNAVDRERSLTQMAVTTTPTNVKQASYQSPKRTVPYTVTADTIPVVDSTNKVIQYRLQQAVTGQQKGLSQKQLENYGSTVKAPKLTVDKNGLISDQDVRQYGPMVALDRNKAALQRVLTTNQQIVKQTTQANQQGLRQLTSDALGNPISYTLTLKRPRQAQGTELYLKLDGIEAQRLTTQDKLMAQANNSVLGGTPLSALTKLNTWRSAVRNPDLGDYWMTVKTRNQTKTFSQFGVDNLSDYEPKSSALLNLGYSTQERDTVSITFNATHQISFKSAKLIAMPFNKSYDRQVHAVQRRGLQRAHVSDNRVTGMLTAAQPSVLTTSIPYSTGWRLTVDGRPVKTQVVNDGFVGAQLATGKHRIQLTYQTPGFLVGSWLTGLGVLSLLGSAGLARWRKH